MRLSPELLLRAYAQGIFPMAEDGEIYWYDPDPRTILPLDGFHVPHSLARAIRKGRFEIRVDTAFAATIAACAAPAPGRESTWIDDQILAVYGRLHDLGYAHSVETWLDGALVGGLYGVALGGLFAGESMWSSATNASKVALVALVERLRAGGFTLLDTQFSTPHLAQFGIVEIPRREYQRRLRAALAVAAVF